MTLPNIGGSCEIDDIAVRIICPVVSIYEKEKVLIYGGSVHFSKDSLCENECDIFGYVYFGETWDVSNKIGYIKSLSQELGIVKLEKSEFKNWRHTERNTCSLLSCC